MFSAASFLVSCGALCYKISVRPFGVFNYHLGRLLFAGVLPYFFAFKIKGRAAAVKKAALPCYNLYTKLYTSYIRKFREVLKSLYLQGFSGFFAFVYVPVFTAICPCFYGYNFMCILCMCICAYV